MNDRETWRERRVLVTGAGGFIGAHLVRALVDGGAVVHAFLADHDPGSPLALAGDLARVHVVSGRLERFALVKAAILEREVDTVFHLGAQTLVGVARRDPLGTFESNVRGTWHVLEACRMAGVKRVVVASSDKAYGDAPRLPYTEDTPLAGRFPYDVSKACADLLAQSYAATYDLPVAIARCGNVYGPGDLNWSRIVPGTIRSLLRGEPPVIRSDGSPVRDYLAVEDTVAAYLALAGWLDDVAGAVPEQRSFNFSSGRPLTVLEMTRRVQAAAGREDLEPVVENTARAEIQAQHLDSARARRELGWRPVCDMDAALSRTAAWYRDYLEPAAPAPARTRSTVSTAAAARP